MEKNNNTDGIGITTVLQIVFIVLKLCGLIHWSWWWVLSPLWISIMIAVVAFLVIAVWWKR